MTGDGSRPNAERKLSYNGGYMDAARVAEELFAAYARTQEFAVIDVRDDPEYQDQIIDYKLLKNGKEYTVEVKSDQHLDVKSNFVFELMRVNHHRAEPTDRFRLGWSTRSKANNLVFYAPTTHCFHMLLMREYRDAANLAIYKLRSKLPIIVVPTDEVRSTITALIPIEYLVAQPSYKKIPVV